MPLYSVASGATILAADVDQYHDTLTGAAANPVSLASTLAVTGVSTLGTVNATQVNAPVAGAVAATTLSASDASSLQAVSGTTGSFSGAVTSDSNHVVEGTGFNCIHAECLFDASTSGSIAALTGYVTKTLTFARPFTGYGPCVSASCKTSAGNQGSIGYGIVGYGAGGTSVTVAFQNLDGNPQTFSDFSILALGN